MHISPDNTNTPAFWEDYMVRQWTANTGRNQTRLFAKYFVDAMPLPEGVRTLLDVSCAMGDALPVIHERYPAIELHGQDISAHAIGEARQSYGDIAQFKIAGFDDLQDYYDVILCSNTFEHFENYLNIASALLKHCSWLYVMVPYLELRRGARLKVEAGEQHVCTFDRRSFDPLLADEAASAIRTRVIYTPGAWGNGKVPFRSKFAAIIAGRPRPVEYRQIIYEIVSGVVRE